MCARGHGDAESSGWEGAAQSGSDVDWWAAGGAGIAPGCGGFSEGGAPGERAGSGIDEREGGGRDVDGLGHRAQKVAGGAIVGWVFVGVFVGVLMGLGVVIGIGGGR